MFEYVIQDESGRARRGQFKWTWQRGQDDEEVMEAVCQSALAWAKLVGQPPEPIGMRVTIELVNQLNQEAKQTVLITRRRPDRPAATPGPYEWQSAFSEDKTTYPRR